jgi:hypothetical protein
MSDEKEPSVEVLSYTEIAGWIYYVVRTRDVSNRALLLEEIVKLLQQSHRAGKLEGMQESAKILHDLRGGYSAGELAILEALEKLK